MGQIAGVTCPLYYFRLRYYDPSHGRFVSRDPIGLWGDPKNLGNGYSFAAADPINGMDPFGDQALVKAPMEFQPLEAGGGIGGSCAAGAGAGARGSSGPGFFETRGMAGAVAGVRDVASDFPPVMVPGNYQGPFVNKVNEYKAIASFLWSGYQAITSGDLQHKPPETHVAVIRRITLVIASKPYYYGTGATGSDQTVYWDPARGRWRDRDTGRYAASPPPVTFDADQLKKKYGHAPVFGVQGGAGNNPASQQAFVAAMQAHLADPSIVVIYGHYRQDEAIFYTNPATGVTIITTPSGAYWSGFRLNAQQLKTLLEKRYFSG